MISFNSFRFPRRDRRERKASATRTIRNDTNRGKVFIISTFDASVYIPYSQIRFVRVGKERRQRGSGRAISPDEAMVGRDGGRPWMVFHGESITWVDGRVRSPK